VVLTDLKKLIQVFLCLLLFLKVRYLLALTPIAAARKLSAAACKLSAAACKLWPAAGKLAYAHNF
tara:strand:+ start:722 stop:916 length:195 start_codon:yes stop_codon:yes gene_type:complete